MGDYADAGYRLQRYKITFYADNNGKIPRWNERRTQYVCLGNFHVSRSPRRNDSRR